MADEPIYCPFCGARLAEHDGAFTQHLNDSDACREGYATWDPPSTVQATPEAAGPSTSTSLRVGVWGLIALVMLYSLFVVQQILVGVIASALIYIAYRIGLEFS